MCWRRVSDTVAVLGVILMVLVLLRCGNELLGCIRMANACLGIQRSPAGTALTIEHVANPCFRRMRRVQDMLRTQAPL